MRRYPSAASRHVSISPPSDQGSGHATVRFLVLVRLILRSRDPESLCFERGPPAVVERVALLP
jgi:hypothetical protein